MSPVVSLLDAEALAARISIKILVSVIPDPLHRSLPEGPYCVCLANSPNCCTGYYSSPSTCPSSGVKYYSYFSKVLSFHVAGN